MKCHVVTGALLLTVAVTAAIPSRASAQVYYDGPSRSYGSMSDPVPDYIHYSQLDEDAKRREMQREAEKRELRDRRQAEYDAKVERRRADKEKNAYVPKAPKQTELQMNNFKTNLTADQVTAGMLESQRIAAARDAAPTFSQHEGYLLLLVGDEPYYVREGLFYIENGRDLLEVPAPAKAMVPSLGPHVQPVSADGVRYYKVGENYFQRVMLNGKPVFETVVPAPVQTEQNQLPQQAPEIGPT